MLYKSYISCDCSSIILKSDGGLNYKVRAKVLVFKDNKAYAICKACSKEVEVPISLDLSVLNPPLIIKR